MLETIKEISYENLYDFIKQVPYIAGSFIGIAILYVRILYAARYAKIRLHKKNVTDLDKEIIKENIYTRIDFFVAALVADFVTTPIVAIPFFTLMLTLYYCGIMTEKTNEEKSLRLYEDNAELRKMGIFTVENIEKQLGEINDVFTYEERKEDLTVWFNRPLNTNISNTGFTGMSQILDWTGKRIAFLYNRFGYSS